MSKDSSNVSISKIVSDNGEDTIYIEKYEKMIKDKKIYTNHIYFYAKGRNEKMYVGVIEDFKELISIYVNQYSISLIYCLSGGFCFINFKHETIRDCGKMEKWVEKSYASNLNGMSAYDGIKYVGWISRSVFYLEPMNPKKRKSIQAVIDGNLWTLAEDEETINNKYLDYKNATKSSFSKYFSNSTWDGMRY